MKERIKKMDVAAMITQIGFPAAVAAYALYVHFKHMDYLEKTLGQAVIDNTHAINELRLLIMNIVDDKQKEGKEDDL